MIRTSQQKALEVTAYIVMGIVAVIILIPFLLLFVASITDEKYILTEGYSLLPKALSLEAYEYIWNSRETILRAYGVTIGVTVVGTLLHVMITAMAGYALSVPDLPGRRILMFLFLFTTLFNGGMVSTYMIYSSVLKIKNTFWALLVPNLLFSPVNCIITRTYFRSNIPQELYDSARIDGASEIRIFLNIVLPLGKPILVTIGIFAGLGYWNDWTNGLLYVTDPAKQSIQQLLNTMISNIQYLAQFGTDVFAAEIPSMGVRMAIAFVAFLPVLIAYPFLQKYFRSGIMIGAVKG